jgi:hypothetical protein
MLADQHDVGDVKRSFKLDDTWLNLGPSSANGALVLLHDIDPRDHDPLALR